MVLVALPGFAVGYGILTRAVWARILGIVVGILDLAIVPVGTVIGAYTLWVLVDEKSKAYFDEA